MNRLVSLVTGVALGFSASGCSEDVKGHGDGNGAGGGAGRTTNTLLYDRDEGFPGAIVVVGDSLYWREEGRILSAPKDGSGPVVDIFDRGISGAIIPGDGELYALSSVDGSSSKQVTRFPLEGGDAEPTPPSYEGEPLRSFNDWTYRDGALFFALSGCEALLQVDPATGDAEALWDSGERAHSTVGATIAVDDENVYCSTRKQVQRVPRGGGTLTPVSALGWGAFAPLVSDGRYLYFGKGLGDALGRLPVDANGETEIEELSDRSACDHLGLSPDRRWLIEVYQGAAGAISVGALAGDDFGPLRVLASKLDSPNSIASDDVYVYWAQNYGVHRMRL